MVRAAQGRHEDAEELFRAAFDALDGTDFRQVELEVLDRYAPFLREAGREDEAERADERRGELFPAAAKSSARIA